MATFLLQLYVYGGKSDGIVLPLVLLLVLS